MNAVWLFGALLAQQDPSAWLDKRIAELQPTAAEKRFDRIGWSTSIVEGLKLAREHRRPVFLFTHDGRMATGRC